MSVDFYAALPAANWPSAQAVQTCMADHAYPLRIKRFPSLDRSGAVTDGILMVIDGKEAYLEGQLAVASTMLPDAERLNDRMKEAGSSEKIRPDDALLSVHVRSPAEMRAVSYVISALIICFEAFGFEPQGNTSGRGDFARSLLSGAEALRGTGALPVP